MGTVCHVDVHVDGYPIHAADVADNPTDLGRLGTLTDDAVRKLADGHVLQLSRSDGTFSFNLEGAESALNKTPEWVHYLEAQEHPSADRLPSQSRLLSAWMPLICRPMKRRKC